MKKIIFAAHDAGGADALVPVIQKIKNRKSFRILNLFSGQAALIARRRRIAFVDAGNCSAAMIARTVASFKPRLVMTGTSSGVYVDKKILKAARRLGIKTAAIVDSWVNYNLQFKFGLRRRSAAAGEDLPDYILVMDAIARREMIEEGFPAKRIVVTGNPHFDGFRKFPKLRSGASDRIVFIDQHLSELMKDGTHEDLGYTEIEVFGDLVKALEKLRWPGELVIKFHPGSADLARFDKIIANSGLRIAKAGKNKSLHDVLNNSRLVVGMTSMALFEAALGGKAVLSYQPGLKRKADPLISNRLGLSAAVYKRDKLKPALKKMLSFARPPAKHLRQIKKYTKRNATQMVVNFIISAI